MEYNRSNFTCYLPPSHWIILAVTLIVLSPLFSPAELSAGISPAPPMPPGVQSSLESNQGNDPRSYFTDLPLFTQQGQEVKFYSDILENRIVLITGFYVNCFTTSPRQNLLLSRLQKKLGDKLGKDVWFASITVDPDRDSPELVREYAQVFAPRPGWIFLSGDPVRINWINHRLGQYTDDPESHRGVYLLGDLKTGDWLKISPTATDTELHSRIKELLNARMQ
jgi:cytochrome oxidase Cu insertion factor (SCO1/SenC/PrrC family)